MICGLSCGFTGRERGRLLDREAPALPVAAPCTWHGHEPQPTTVSHDGRARRPTRRACVSVPPTDLRHVAAVVDQSELRRPLRDGSARALSPAVTIRAVRPLT